MELCLTSIVKNESGRIKRMLDSVAPHIACFCITDTGSTDGTPELIAKYFQEKKISGVVNHCEFKDWSYARNFNLNSARALPVDFDYCLLVDADMELRVLDPDWLAEVKGPSYDMFQKTNALIYKNRRFATKNTTNGYVGVTHEFLNLPEGGCVSPDRAYFYDYADGANRPDKFKRDIKLLKEGIDKEPANSRYYFYLAQSYRDAGKPDKAAKWYRKRVAAGGWAEEQWCAQYHLGAALRDSGNEAGFVFETLKAYQMRPWRAEPLYDLARYYREKPDQQKTSLLFSEAGMQVPFPKDDALFINRYVYDCGMKDEFAICAFYDDARRKRGFDITDELSLKPGEYEYSRELARHNLYYYSKMLGDYCPSFKWKPIDFQAPDGYIAMNPSVVEHKGALQCNVRCVNYHIDEYGRYLIRGTDGTANGTNPIDTRNFLVWLDDDLNTVAKPVEILPPGNKPPVLFNFVTGLEDLRLFTYDDELYASTTVREFTPEGWCEQAYVNIGVAEGETEVTWQNIKRMINRPRAHEKNWMPILGSEFKWMYRPGDVVDATGASVLVQKSGWDTHSLAGSSQVIPFDGGYIAAVHQARTIPDKPTRYYLHRFIWFDNEFNVRKISKPFSMHEKAIEYIAGMVYRNDKFLISYGFKDCEARLAVVDASEVRNFLWHE